MYERRYSTNKSILPHVEGIWRNWALVFASCQVSDEEMLALKGVLCLTSTKPFCVSRRIKGDPVDAEQYGSESEGR